MNTGTILLGIIVLIGVWAIWAYNRFVALTKAMGAQSVADHAAAENMLTSALKSLFAVSESYPDLKANTNFIELQRELSDTENKIQAARRFYNSVVIELQNALEQFPTNLIGNM